MYKFSFYSAPIRNIIPLKTVSLSDVATIIKSNEYRPITEKLRGLESKAELDVCKASELDYVTFSGTFSKRSEKSLIQHSGYLSIDIDNIENPVDIDSIKDSLISLIEAALIFTSPSAKGLKIVFLIDISQGEHQQYFTAFQNFFRQKFNIEIDVKCKDVSRACFLCYDPQCYISENPTLLGKTFIETYISLPETIRKPNATIITDQSLIIEKLIVWINKKHSFTVGNRNKYISELCAAFNRYGIDKQLAIESLLKYAEPGFTESEIKATANSIYNNTALFNTAYFEAATTEELYSQSHEPNEATPLMPITGFPKFIQKFILECNRIYGTHRDFWAAAILAATSTAIGQSVTLKTQYENATIFWLAVVGPSGSGKSEPFKLVFKKIHELDKLAHKEYQQQFKKWKVDMKTLAKGDTPPDIPICKQFIQIDVTPEAMAKGMNENIRGITIIREELQGWIEDFGRYSKSGEQQNLLSIWSQQVFKVNRVNSESLFIENPFANVFGGIQPSILHELAKDNRSINGFLPRFCFAFPDKTKSPRFQREELSSEIIKEYEAYIVRLISIPSFRSEIRLTNEAMGLYGEFVNKNADLNDSGKQSNYMNEVNSKLNIIVLRAALLFHLSQWAFDSDIQPQISATTMNSAIELVEYFRITAHKVYLTISQGNETKNKKSIAKYLISIGNSQSETANILKVSQQYISKISK